MEKTGRYWTEGDPIPLKHTYAFLFSSTLFFSDYFYFLLSFSFFDQLLLSFSHSSWRPVTASTYLQATTVSAPSHVFHAIQFYCYFKLAEYIVLLIINHFNSYIKSEKKIKSTLFKWFKLEDKIQIFIIIILR